MSKLRASYVLNLDQNIHKGINRVKSQFFEAASDGKLTFIYLFKTIPVKKQGKYNLNVHLQDLGNIFYRNFVSYLLEYQKNLF